MKTDLKIESLDVYDVDGAKKVLKKIKSYLSKIGVKV
jgi:hypothetical protein